MHILTDFKYTHGKLISHIQQKKFPIWILNLLFDGLINQKQMNVIDKLGETISTFQQT